MSAADAAPQMAPETIVAAAGDFLRAARDQARDTLELAAAEARLAAMTAFTMVVLAILAAALALIGWGLVVAAAAQIGLQAGLSWAQALLGLGALHIVCAWLAWRSAMRMSAQLTLPALRQALLGQRPQT